jgi:MFS transporter, DHA1 family, inner membrane transport protein
MTHSTTPPARVLPTLVLAQFAGTSLWFAINAVMPDLQQAYGWTQAAVGTLTNALQMGFIAGTLVFALLAIADRFSTRRIFMVCALAGAACTLGARAHAADITSLIVWRAATGFFLAGIYPVGMKIAAQWFPQRMGSALGLLVGALVLGSASPHALRALGAGLPWDFVMLAVAALAALGGVGLFFALPEAPQPASSALNHPPVFQWRALSVIWTAARVRASALGYFGHMWELYSFWVLTPLILATRLEGADLSWAAFVVLGSGALGCVGGGWAASRWGSARVAFAQLATSGLCGLLAPWMLAASAPVFAAWLVLWGITVSGDSPQFSALTASHAPAHQVGSVLTLVNSAGFALSMVSIAIFVQATQTHALAPVLPWLSLGPALGLWALLSLLRPAVANHASVVTPQHKG